MDEQGCGPFDTRADAQDATPATAPLLLLLGLFDAESRERWQERFAREGFDAVAPALHVAVQQDVDMLVSAAAARKGDQKIGIVARAEFASHALALAGSGTVDAVVIVAAPQDIPQLLADAIPACPVAIHLPMSPVVPIDALRAAADSKGIELLEIDAPADFADAGAPGYDRHADAVVHSRTLAALRPALGARVDFGRLFREHLAQEFRHQDADATMRTMVAEPYVNHIPTLTGGFGHDMLKRFYKYHFIPSAARSQDRRTTLVSEVIGADSVVLEMVVSFVHNEEHEYMLPGLKPTGRRLTIPSVVIAKFQGDKLCREHVYWDQASLLAQIGALDPRGLPISGAEQAAKVLDPSLPSNAMMPAWADSRGKPI